MDWSISDIPSQAGKIAVITGANAGIGRATATVLAEKGAEVVLAVRNDSKGEEAAEAIRTEHPGANLHVMELDLSDLASVRSFAKLYLATFDRLDLLINNAGYYSAQADETSTDGFAVMMAVNHLGHFALTGLLIELLRETNGSRVVTLSSGAHSSGKIDPDTFHTTKAARKRPYANSKLANMLFTLELQRKLDQASGTTISVAAGPGPTKSDGAQKLIQSISNGLLRNLADSVSNVLMSPSEKGAWPVLRAATDPQVKGGDYFTPSGFMSMRGAPVVKASAESAKNTELAKALWNRTAELTDIGFHELGN